ncbi:thiol peroxidase [Vaginella massiliensis]|uniref:thiol peroxidase n=1 Tax=Vaginella massiliensis TaxID=1816680 RepID=UPI000A542DBA|nr:thiol peroxidase [Vaginella massiliensis]
MEEMEQPIDVQITFKGEEVRTKGIFTRVGAFAHDFSLPDSNGKMISLSDFKGKKVVLNIFPKINTPVCAASVRKFNEEATKLTDTVVINISKDSQEEIANFCAAEGIDNVYTLSAANDNDFELNYGVGITTEPLEGLFARVVIVLNRRHEIFHQEVVPKIEQEPDYEKALAVLKEIE